MHQTLLLVVNIKFGLLLGRQHMRATAHTQILEWIPAWIPAWTRVWILVWILVWTRVWILV